MMRFLPTLGLIALAAVLTPLVAQAANDMPAPPIGPYQPTMFGRDAGAPAGPSSRSGQIGALPPAGYNPGTPPQSLRSSAAPSPVGAAPSQPQTPGTAQFPPLQPTPEAATRPQTTGGFPPLGYQPPNGQAAPTPAAIPPAANPPAAAPSEPQQPARRAANPWPSAPAAGTAAPGFAPPTYAPAPPANSTLAAPYGGAPAWPVPQAQSGYAPGYAQPGYGNQGYGYRYAPAPQQQIPPTWGTGGQR